jgi:hypothetical protein
MTEPSSVAYREDHAALTAPLLVLGLVVPGVLVIVFAVLGVAVDPAWFIAVVLTPFFGPFLIYVSLLYRNWPTGIVMDERGVSIGAVGSKRAPGRDVTVNHQAWGVFTVPWSAVREARVETDPTIVRALGRPHHYFTTTRNWGVPRGSGSPDCALGVLIPPFARAVLVIELDGLDRVQAPSVRPARYFSNWIYQRRLSRRMAGLMSSTWIVSTRRPAEVEAALVTRGVGEA